MKIVGIIPARYASARFPGKPLALINGKTMIRRVYEQTLKSSLDAVVVATDDVRIADEVMSFGGAYVLTDPNHRSGTDRCCEALGLLDEQYDAVVNIQGDEPFIDPEQINIVAQLVSGDAVQIASLAKRITDAGELFSPNTVKVVLDKDKRALYFSRSPIPFMRNMDQSAWLGNGVYYKHVGVYAFKSATLREIAMLKPSSLECCESLEQLRWLENGFSIHMAVTESDNVSIDVPDDIRKAEDFANARQTHSR